MKKNGKLIILLYVGAFFFTLLWVNRIEKLESYDDLRNNNESIVFKIR